MSTLNNFKKWLCDLLCKNKKSKKLYDDVLKKNYNNIQSVVTGLTMAEEAIAHSLTLSSLILNKQITSDNFQQVDLPAFIRKINWTEHPESFLEQAQSLPMSTAAFWIIACAEGYNDLSEGTTVDKEKNSDLYSAQMILKIIRNSFGHPFVNSKQIKITWNVEEKKYKNRFEIKEISIVLDARQLNKKEFKLGDLGGWENLFKLFEYLKSDLLKKLNK